MYTKEDLFNICFYKKDNGTYKQRTLNCIYKINNNIEADIKSFISNKEYNITSIKELLYILKNDLFDKVPFKCPTCNNKYLKFLESKNRYQHHCCPSCASNDSLVVENRNNTLSLLSETEKQDRINKIKTTWKKKTKDELKSINIKQRKTKLEKYGSETYNNSKKALKTYEEKHGHKRTIKPMSDGVFKKYGCKTYLDIYYKTNIRNSKELIDKINKTKKNNHTFNTSKSEERCYNILINKFGVDNVIRQYKSDVYPFQCDFYIKSINAYIECNFHWTHGEHKFDCNYKDDINILNKWKELSTTSKFYNNAISTWTIRDIKKFEYAKKNNLNYLVFYNENDFIKYYS